MALDDVLKGAGSGAALGGTIGSIIPGVGTAIGTAAGGLIGGAAGGFFGRKKSDETKIQKKQRQLVDQLLQSLNGQGPYSSLFSANQQDFERTFAEPARARFKNQTAPQIQQSYIAGGQQRSTGLEDTLTRAGVDMDQLLNEYFSNYQQGAQNRQSSAISAILGQGKGADNAQSYGQAIGQGIAGYASGNLGNDIGNIVNAFDQRRYNAPYSEKIEDKILPPRKGFEKEPQVYNPYTGVQQ